MYRRRQGANTMAASMPAVVAPAVTEIGVAEEAVGWFCHHCVAYPIGLDDAVPQLENSTL